MDLTNTVIPKSDQVNAEDLLTGSRTVTITEVRGGTDEQPVNVHLAEFPGRPFRPSKTVLRILIAAWGKESDVYIGRRLTIYRDPEVRFGGQDVGGIRVSHMSHIAKPLKLALTVSKGKKAPYVVQPLVDAVAAPARPKPNVEALIENAQEARHNADLDAIARAAVGLSGDELETLKAVVTARRAELKDAAEPTLPGADQ